MKKIFLPIIVLIICVFLVTSCKNEEVNNFTQIDYSNNIEAMEYYFPELGSINNGYFKSISLNGESRTIGPSTFCVAGFLCISKEAVNVFLDGYEFIKKDPSFPLGVSPEVTEYVDFSWYTSNEFSKYLLKGNFVGDVYIDIMNCLIYINIQSA